jgi:signal transduction histidine kinase
MSALPAPTLERATFRTNRLLDFCSRKELIAQTGHGEDEWPLVVLKELVDNALEACEDAGVAPVVSVAVDEGGIEVADNGPGLPAETLEGVLDFSVRVSSREAYVAPDRGAGGAARARARHEAPREARRDRLGGQRQRRPRPERRAFPGGRARQRSSDPVRP